MRSATFPPGEARRIEMAAYTLRGRAGQPGYNLALLTKDPVMPIPSDFHYEGFFYAQTASGIPTTGTLTLTPTLSLNPSPTPSPTATPVPTPCADVDGNGVLDAADLVLLLLDLD